MKTSKVPVTIQRWIDKNQSVIDEFWMENDEAGEYSQPWSIWLYFKKGWVNEMTETHCIHESLVRDFMEHTQYMVPCTCHDCTGE